MEQAPKRQGRPTKDPARHKRGHNISMTDDEWKRLGELAQAANRGISEYVVETLGLNKPAAPDAG
jgi:hypothetical protein